MTDAVLRTEPTSPERASRAASLAACAALLLLSLGWELSLGHPVWAAAKALPLLPALVIWAAAEYFARKRRMALPALLACT